MASSPVKPRESSASPARDLRPPRYHWAILLLVVATSVGYASFSFSTPSSTWQRVFAVLYLLVAFGAVVELGRKRIRLDDDGLYFVSNFRGKRIARTDIDSVTWAQGAGVSIKLVDGKWVHLPEVGNGSQALTNVIRAWLKRTATSR
jgi:hypothetical protein